MSHIASVRRPRAKDLDGLPRYSFDDLKPGEKMRVLKVHPADNFEDAVVCELEHKPVTTQPVIVDGPIDAKDKIHRPTRAVAEKFSYEALSYRWGVGEFNQSIRILGKKDVYHFPVHEHLYEALLELREKSRFRYLWIDTICINQSLASERSSQVARMNEVYGDAEHVRIWLGAAADRSNQALGLLQGEKKGLDVYDFDKNCTDEDFIRDWASFLMLLKRQWFSRRWVVQEISLAQRATVHCGSTWVDWEDLAAAVSLLNEDACAKRLSSAAKKLEILNNPTDLFGEVGALTASKLVNTASRLFRRSVDGQHQQISTLEDTVARLAMFQTSEPKDYIYALLALAKDSQPYAGIPDYLDGQPLNKIQQRALYTVMRLLPSPYQQMYTVDYDQETVEVFQQFIHFAISKSDGALALDVICRPFAPSDMKDLPSWIPNVDDLPHAAHVDAKGSFKMKRERGDPFVSMPDTSFHYAAAGRKPLERNKLRFRKRKNHYSMFVEGFILDTVNLTKIGAASQKAYIPNKWKILGNEHKDSDAFWRTLVADRGPKGGVPGIYKNVITPNLGVTGTGFDIEGHIQENGSSSIVADAFQHVQATIWGLCLFETGRRRLGLGPSKLENIPRAGGRLLVCILHGCSVPIILQEFVKSDQEIKNEADEDEIDRLDRQDKALKKPTIQKLIKRVVERRAVRNAMRKGRHSRDSSNVVMLGHDSTSDSLILEAPSEAAPPMPGDSFKGRGVSYRYANGTTPQDEDSPARSSPGGPSSAEAARKHTSSETITWLQRPFMSSFFILAVAVIMAFILEQHLAAGMLMIFAAPHAVTDILRRGAYKNDDLAPILALLSLVTLVIFYVGSSVPLAAVFVTLTDAVYTGLLPPHLAERYQLFLTNITQVTLSDLPSVLWSFLKRRRVHSKWVESPPLPEVGPETLTNGASGQEDTGKRPAHQANNKENNTGHKPTSSLKAPHASSVPSSSSTDVPRPDRYYRVIGECYVHGMMNGEAIKWQNDTVIGHDDGRVMTQTFELR